MLQERHPRRTADQDAFVFEKDKSEAAEVAALRERLQGMKIVARAKVTQDRVYSAAYHPDPTTDLIFFGGECTLPFEVSLISDWLAYGAPLKDKHGQLGIWDPRAPLDDAGEEDNVVDSGQRESGKYWRLQVHWPATSQSSISCIKFDPIDAHNVCYIPTSSLLFFLTSRLMEGVHKCVRLYNSLALLYLRDLARGVYNGRRTHYKHGRPPRKPRAVALRC